MRWKAVLLIFVLGVLSVGTLFVFGSTAFETPAPPNAAEDAPVAATKTQPLVTFIDPSKGPKDAKNLIVEYGDFGCPYCRAVDKDVARLVEAHPADLRYVWKTVTDPNIPGSTDMAKAAFCAQDQGKFWEYRARLLEASSTTSETELSLLAKELGLDVDAFTACLTSGASVPLIERNVAEAQALGVDGLPYFFINGKRLSGQLTYEQLEAALR